MFFGVVGRYLLVRVVLVISPPGPPAGQVPPAAMYKDCADFQIYAVPASAVCIKPWRAWITRRQRWKSLAIYSLN